MNQFSFELAKTLIEISLELNSDYSTKDALLFRILKSAMRLVKCKESVFISVNSVDGSCILAGGLKDGSYIEANKLLPSDFFANTLFEKQDSLILNSLADNYSFYRYMQDFFSISVQDSLRITLPFREKVVAIIELFNLEDKNLTSEERLLIELFEKIASQSYVKMLKDYSVPKVPFSRNNSTAKKQIPNAFHDFLVVSPVIKDLMTVVKKAAITNSSVLITGESGVGKELFAEQIYLNSKRSNKPFIRVNCAALSDSLMESEFFGHEKGAFTSADSLQKGRFEVADGGTIFLDEIGEIPLSLQVKLLRVIQDKQFERVGSSQTVDVDVRIIAATNRNLEKMVKEGTFREDLYFRLNVLPIRVPPLRERVEDIIPLANKFLAKYSEENGKLFEGFDENARICLENYSWPGNVRELENCIVRACILGNPPFIKTENLRLDINAGVINEEESSFDGRNLFAEIRDSSPDKSLKSVVTSLKRAYVIHVLEECGWNQTKAGKVLGIQRTYVSRLMSELHIRER